MVISIIIITIIQLYIVWMTYANWFKKNITYCEMKDSYSFIGTNILSVLTPIPLLPLIAIIMLTGKKYLTLKWMF